MHPCHDIPVNQPRIDLLEGKEVAVDEPVGLADAFGISRDALELYRRLRLGEELRNR